MIFSGKKLAGHPSADSLSNDAVEAPNQIDLILWNSLTIVREWHFERCPVKVINCKQRHGAQHLAVPFPDVLRLIGNGKALPAENRIFNAEARADQRPKPAGFSVTVFISVLEGV